VHATLVRMKAVAIIPARLASTRLDRKMLREIAGEPLIVWVYRAVERCPLLDQIVVATDADEIFQCCHKRNIPVRMTSSSHRSGTERAHEVAQAIKADVYLNVQGDEPLTRPEHIVTLLEIMARPGVEVGTLKTPAANIDINNPGAVKVVTDSLGRALYFSRATIPHDRDAAHPRYYKHLGLYAHTKKALDMFVSWPESALERSERLEQLRFLENGIPIFVAETPFDTVGVDAEDDLRRVEEILLNLANPKPA
jgi:3-deoxy-manno-octulosonate cytidylyltransferase (CMP-KDO synthetase)